jgi:multidrug efflux pump subunit AcrB
MANKIDIRCILHDHLHSLVYTDGKRNGWDLVSFFLMPLLCALLFPLNGWDIETEALSTFGNMGAIFIALLISVLVMIFDQCQKLTDKLKSLPADYDYAYRKLLDDRRRLIKQLFANISYAIVVSIFLLVFSLLQQFFGEESTHWFSVWVARPACVFLAINLLLTALMIIKRTYICLTVS